MQSSCAEATASDKEGKCVEEAELEVGALEVCMYRCLCTAAGSRVGEVCRGINLTPAITAFPLGA